ncbi:MAG: N-methyl-L-tryptophan oxidase [Candidatus Promineifilaceae bacterium]|nr:N-methyl-L-tryptophan oxidase [Candidatus Promineifilaceae bacterium]
MNNNSSSFDTVVIGVGGMGSAACYQLASRGQKVLGLEQFDIPHTQGSSHGYTRIIRLAYYEHPSYVPLLKRAYELWTEIEHHYGEPLFYKTGSVDVGTAESQVFKGSLESCLEHNLAHEVLSGESLNQRYPGYHVPANFMALYQPNGGFLLPEKSTVAFVEAAHHFGAVIQAREKVESWRPLNEGVQVTTNRGSYTAGSLVITAGAWNRTFLPFLSDLAVPERQVLAWLQPQKPEWFAPEQFPVFNMQVGTERYYGFPVFGVPGFKFGKYGHQREAGMPETFDWEPNETDEALLRAYAAEFFPNGSGPTMSLKTCMFTNSPDDHFIIDLHPEYPQVSFAAGFSGHGYKFASVIGEIMADLAIDQDSDHDIGLFHVDRFLS